MELYDSYASFNNLSIREILDYLFVNFKEVSEGDIEKLKKVFLALFNLNKLFRNYVKVVEDAINQAEVARYPYTPQKIIS